MTAHIIHLAAVSRPRTAAFKPFRVYAQVDGVYTVLRSFKTMATAMRNAASTSVAHSVAEVRDDAATMNRRLVAVFRKGILVGTTRDH